jgi:hypothetical protein
MIYVSNEGMSNDLPMRTFHRKRVSNLGMEVMGKSASRSRKREEEGGGTIERVRRYRQLLGIGLTFGILR